MAQPIDVLCIATQTKAVDMKPWKAKRRPVGDYDVLIDMKYCGICHSCVRLTQVVAAGTSSFFCVRTC